MAKSTNVRPRRLVRCIVSLTALVCIPARLAQTATVEFDNPYQFHLLSGGEVLEMSGTFSWSVPQNFQVTLASLPQVRIISFDSPGGQLKAAAEVAEIIRSRGLTTYVGRFCASACTVAFLGGTQRWLGPDARLGFHQAHAPGFPMAEADLVLRAAYQKFELPAPFVAHVLRTPPTDLWFPKPPELRAAHITTGAPPETITALEQNLSRSLTDSLPLVRGASDHSVVQFATATSELLTELHKADPEACWAFAHQGTTDLEKLVPPRTFQAFLAAEARMAEDVSSSGPVILNAGERKAVASELMQSLQKEGQASVLYGLQPTSDHPAFCRSVENLLRAALALPEPRRISALRVLLSGG